MAEVQEPVVNLEEEHTVRLGRAARQLRDSDLLKLVTSNIMKQTQMASTNSGPGEREQREQLYWLGRGVSAVVDELNRMSNDAMVLEDKAKEQKAEK